VAGEGVSKVRGGSGLTRPGNGCSGSNQQKGSRKWVRGGKGEGVEAAGGASGSAGGSGGVAGEGRVTGRMSRKWTPGSGVGLGLLLGGGRGGVCAKSTKWVRMSPRAAGGGVSGVEARCRSGTIGASVRGGVARGGVQASKVNRGSRVWLSTTNGSAAHSSGAKPHAKQQRWQVQQLQQTRAQVSELGVCVCDEAHVRRCVN
jgi:hypothetical protein